MQHIFNTSETVTSNMIYPQISKALQKWIQPENALLLVPSPSQKDELSLVDVIGRLPGSLRFEGLIPGLTRSSVLASDIQISNADLSAYNNMIAFKEPDQRSYAYFLYTGAAVSESPELYDFIDKTTHLLKIKDAFDSLPVLEKTLSKLKYQLSFFASAINNIFEPYPSYMLAQLYMEIISEMFLLPAAVTFEYIGGEFKALYAKGRKLDQFSDLKLDPGPFLKNQDLRQFPTIIAHTTPEHIGMENYRQLSEHRIKVVMPLNTGDELRYIIAGISSVETHFDYQDQVNLLALGNTLNHALSFSHIQASLTEQTRQLDKKIFNMSALFNAAESIMSDPNIGSTMTNSLDMIMEIFQSAISGVVLRSRIDERFELVKLKSVHDSQNIRYFLERPKRMPRPSRVLLRYRDIIEDRTEFLSSFPEFALLEKTLQPVIIAQIFCKDKYYGFISLSDRVTGDKYDDEAMNLLGLLVNTISLAVDNAFMYEELQENNALLNHRLREIYALKDIIGTIKSSTTLDHFCNQLAVSLEMGIGAGGIKILMKNGDGLKSLYGEWPASEKNQALIMKVRRAGIANYVLKRRKTRALVFPFNYTPLIEGYLLIHSFDNTVLENDDRFRMVEMIAAIASESVHNLILKDAASPDGVMDFYSHMLNHLKQEIAVLDYVFLPSNLVMIKHKKPEAFIRSSSHWSTGFMVAPGVALLITPLLAEDIPEKMADFKVRYEVFPAAELENVLALVYARKSK